MDKKGYERQYLKVVKGVEARHTGKGEGVISVSEWNVGKRGRRRGSPWSMIHRKPNPGPKIFNKRKNLNQDSCFQGCSQSYCNVTGWNLNYLFDKPKNSCEAKRKTSLAWTNASIPSPNFRMVCFPRRMRITKLSAAKHRSHMRMRFGVDCQRQVTPVL